jgi:hypothetical protein
MPQVGGIWEGMAAVSVPDLIREETASLKAK